MTMAFKFSARSTEEHQAKAKQMLSKAGHSEGKADKKADMAMIRSAIGKHEVSKHPGASLTKLARGGSVAKHKASPKGAKIDIVINHGGDKGDAGSKGIIPPSAGPMLPPGPPGGGLPPGPPPGGLPMGMNKPPILPAGGGMPPGPPPGPPMGAAMNRGGIAKLAKGGPVSAAGKTKPRDLKSNPMDENGMKLKKGGVAKREAGGPLGNPNLVALADRMRALRNRMESLPEDRPAAKAPAAKTKAPPIPQRKPALPISNPYPKQDLPEPTDWHNKRDASRAEVENDIADEDALPGVAKTWKKGGTVKKGKKK